MIYFTPVPGSLEPVQSCVRVCTYLFTSMYIYVYMYLYMTACSANFKYMYVCGYILHVSIYMEVCGYAWHFCLTHLYVCAYTCIYT